MVIGARGEEGGGEKGSHESWGFASCIMRRYFKMNEYKRSPFCVAEAFLAQDRLSFRPSCGQCGDIAQVFVLKPLCKTDPLGGHVSCPAAPSFLPYSSPLPKAVLALPPSPSPHVRVQTGARRTWERGRKRETDRDRETVSEWQRRRDWEEAAQTDGDKTH